MTKKFLLLSLVGIFALTLAGCGQKIATTNTSIDTKTETTQKPATKDIVPDKNINTKPLVAVTETTTKSDNNSVTTNKTSEPALGLSTVLPVEETVESSNIKLTSPQSGAIIPSPFLITGQAKSFDNQIYIKMVRDDGRVIMEEFSSRIKNIKGAGEWGEFSTKPWYEVVHSEEANLEVYTKNESNEIASKVIIPIKFERVEIEQE